MKWFYTLRNSVKGPYTTQEFEMTLNQLGSDIASTLVWTRGRSEWLPAEHWNPSEQAILKSASPKPNPQATAKQKEVNTAVKPSEKNSLHSKSMAPEKTNLLTPELKLEDTIEASESNLIPESFGLDLDVESNDNQPDKPDLVGLQNELMGLSPQQKQKPAHNSKNAVKNDGPETALTHLTTPSPKGPVRMKPQPDVEPPSRIADINDVIVPSDDEITRLLGASAMDVIESMTETIDEKYRVQYNGADQPLMTKKELIEFTSLQADPGLIQVMDKKTNEWKEIYTFTDIIEKLGLSRRQNRRVTILGQFKGKTKDGRDLSVRMMTISMGGFGLTDCFDLKIGDTITGQITSPHFYSPLPISAEVTYAGSHGNVGLRFTTINDESQALVVDYIKKFGKGIKTENG